MSYEDDALNYRIEHDINVGTLVEVLREPTLEERKDYHSDIWIDDPEGAMVKSIGGEYTVIKIDDTGDFLLDSGYWYPYSVIGKVE